MITRLRLSATVATVPIVLLVLAGSLGCRREELRSSRESRILMGTLVEVTVVAEDDTARDHLEAAFRELSRLDGDMGTHYQHGAAWDLNERGWPDGFTVNDELFDLLTRAREVGRESEGAFDVTIGAASSLWSFDAEGRIPEAGELAAAVAAVGWEGLRLDPGSRRVTFLRPGMKLDLGGIAKGYAVDRARRVLEERGVTAGIVNAGGDLAAWGMRPADGRPWRVGIQDPRDPSKLLGTLSLTARAVVTSGDYERYFMLNGRRYHHVLDPATGYPSRGLEGVTVVADRAEEADAWATALMVIGPEAARRVLEEREKLEGILIEEGGTIYVSPGLRSVWQPR